MDGRPIGRRFFWIGVVIALVLAWPLSRAMGYPYWVGVVVVLSGVALNAVIREWASGQ